jgi:ferredoxin
VKELFVAFLAQHDDASWLRVVERLEPAIHPVDRAATRIWFHFYPLLLQRMMDRSDAPDLARRMTLAGQWRLADRIGRSHDFLFGHRYWGDARRAVLDAVASVQPPGSLDLAAQVQEIARRLSSTSRVPPELLVGITAVALRTLQQVGPERLESSDDPPARTDRFARMTADEVVARRERSGSGLLGALLGWKKPAVTFDERREDGRFPVVPSQHLTTAARLDTRDYRRVDARCTEGPIPTDCRSCSCGTCWVGILAGSKALTPVDSRERIKLSECGVSSEEPQPVIRLACMAQASADVTIVIPPWNGLVGRVAGQIGLAGPGAGHVPRAG